MTRMNPMMMNAYEQRSCLWDHKNENKSGGPKEAASKSPLKAKVASFPEWCGSARAYLAINPLPGDIPTSSTTSIDECNRDKSTIVCPCTTYYAKTPFKQVVILCRIWSESVALNVCAETHPANSFLCRACSPPPVPPSWLGTVPGNGMKIRRPCCQQQQFNTTAQDKNTSLHRKQ